MQHPFKTWEVIHVRDYRLVLSGQILVKSLDTSVFRVIFVLAVVDIFCNLILVGLYRFKFLSRSHGRPYDERRQATIVAALWSFPEIQPDGCCRNISDLLLRDITEIDCAQRVIFAQIRLTRIDGCEGHMGSGMLHSFSLMNAIRFVLFA